MTHHPMLKMTHILEKCDEICLNICTIGKDLLSLQQILN